jgi:membrane protein implicated in regulation of membrane protease activity
VKAGAVFVAGGGVALFLAGIAFVVFAIAVLATFMPVWLSALLVTVALAVVGAVVANVGLKRLKQVHGPQKTIRTLKEDSQWASRTMHSMKSQMHGHA